MGNPQTVRRGRQISRLPFTLRPLADVYEVTGAHHGWHVQCQTCRSWIFLPRRLLHKNSPLVQYLHDHAVQHRKARP